MIQVLYLLLVTSLSGILAVNETKFCEKRNNDYRRTLAKVGEGIWESIEDLELESDLCRNDLNRFLIQGLENAELWALQMFDASAKFPSGVLSGNVNQFGDFDECLSIKNLMLGKYCLASVDLNAENLGFSGDIDSMLHAHHFIRSNMTDIGHRVPRTSTIYWGFCIPSSCSSADLERILTSKINDTRINVSVEDKNCAVNEKKESGAKKYTIIFFTLLIGLSILAAKLIKRSAIQKKHRIHKLLQSFSLDTNVQKFLNTDSKDDAKGVDGIRALNALGLLLGHKSVALFFSPYVNRTYMSERLGEPWAVIGRTAIIYTDSFILISGYLTARTLFKDLNKRGDFKFVNKLINRIFRILPTLLCIILFCTFILPELGNGPMWDMVVTEHSRLCKKNMWKSFIFIHNYMGFENMCLTHTHQLGIDMQLFVMAPLIVTLLWKDARRGLLITVLIMVLSTILRFVVTIRKNISTVIYFGMPVQTFFDTANFSYILPTHRATIYLMGVLLAYFMSLKTSKIQMNKVQLLFGWIFFLSLGCLSMFGPWHMGLRSYKYSNVEAALYTAFSPITWGSFIAWIIWACGNDYSGWFGRFLSWRGFKLFTKISFGVYLTQFPVFFYHVGKQRNAGFYSLDMMFDLYEILAITILSSALAIFVEIPFTNVAKWMLDEEKEGANKEKPKIEENNNEDTTPMLENSKYIKSK